MLLNNYNLAKYNSQMENIVTSNSNTICKRNKNKDKVMITEYFQ